MGSDVTHGAPWALRSVVVEEGRLNSQAVVVSSALTSLTVKSEKNIDRVTNILESNFLEERTCASLGDGVAKGADTFLGMVNDAGVIRIVVLESKGRGEGPEVPLLRHRFVVDTNNAASGHRAVGRRHAHTAVTDPDKIPHVAVWRNGCRDSLWKTIYGEFRDSLRGPFRWRSISLVCEAVCSSSQRLD